MSWAEIKNAVNSTVGTNNFKPLNEIIRGNWNLIESDKVYISEVPEYTSSSETYNISNSFRFKAPGTAKIRLKASYESNTTYNFEIYKNGAIYKTISQSGNDTAYKTTIQGTISFVENDLITFRLVKKKGIDSPSMSEIAVLCEAVYAPILVESV